MIVSPGSDDPASQAGVGTSGGVRSSSFDTGDNGLTTVGGIDTFRYTSITAFKSVVRSLLHIQVAGSPACNSFQYTYPRSLAWPGGDEYGTWVHPAGAVMATIVCPVGPASCPVTHVISKSPICAFAWDPMEIVREAAAEAVVLPMWVVAGNVYPPTPGYSPALAAAVTESGIFTPVISVSTLFRLPAAPWPCQPRAVRFVIK